MMKETKIERTSLSMLVAQQLQKHIEAGTYPVGQQLPSEHELTREFGVGRSSVREAIRMLVNNGFVRVQQGLGTFVLSSTSAQDPLSLLLQTAEDEDVRDVRELLEIKIAERAALHRSAADVKIMQASLEKRNAAANAGHLIPWVEAEIAFYNSIADATGNKVLANLYRVFARQDLKKKIEENYTRSQSLHKLTTLHIQLLESIVSRQPGKAVEITWKLNRP
ncbi:MAG TPA: GntR family transcriptional regulator [Puia sp.]|jgi:DNA-binding FadR family transcriptional regulator|nr:GntR family transcriptional regulator [Puia sp.]